MKKFEDILINIKQNDGNKAEPESCLLCNNTGYIFQGDMALRCKCQTENDYIVRQKRAGITPHLRKMTFDEFDFSYYSSDKRGENHLTYKESAVAIVKVAKSFCRDILEDKETQGIVFMGSVGCGKTYLSAAIANELVANEVDVEFVVVPDFLDELRATFDYNSSSKEIELMNRIKSVPVLILDDLGAHNYTEWSIKTLFAIMNYRVNYELPMIVTTNLTIEEIEDLIGSRIYSRLLESCRFFRLKSGFDIRALKRKQENNRIKQSR